MLRQRAVVAVFVVVLLLGVVPVGESTHEDGWCARDLETVKLGTGNVGIDIAVLNGVNHVDVPYPACSVGGRFNIDHSSNPVLTEQHCDDRFLRVYAPAGAVGYTAVINWVSSSTPCS